MKEKFNEKIKPFKVYSKHGQIQPLGVPCIYKGQRVLANYNGKGFTSYTTYEEFTAMFFGNKPLPVIDLCIE